MAQVTRILIATLWVVVLLDLLTHGQAAVQISNALGGVWINILRVLTGQNVTPAR